MKSVFKDQYSILMLRSFSLLHNNMHLNMSYFYIFIGFFLTNLWKKVHFYLFYNFHGIFNSLVERIIIIFYFYKDIYKPGYKSCTVKLKNIFSKKLLFN